MVMPIMLLLTKCACYFEDFWEILTFDDFDLISSNENYAVATSHYDYNQFLYINSPAMPHNTELVYKK